MAALVVADTSVLIALTAIGRLALLEGLFGSVAIPPAVEREAKPGLPRLPPWIETYPLRRALEARVLEASLHAGESEAISLALETQAERLILDDLRARRLAQRLGLAVIGTAGVLFVAKQRGLIPAVRPLLDALRARDSGSERMSMSRF